MILEGAYGTFGSVVLVYVRGYELVSDITVILNGTLVFGADFIINHLEVDLVALQSEAVHYGVVVGNAILLIIGIKRGNNYGVVVAMVVIQEILITAVRACRKCDTAEKKGEEAEEHECPKNFEGSSKKYGSCSYTEDGRGYLL